MWYIRTLDYGWDMLTLTLEILEQVIFLLLFFSFINQIPVERQQCVQVYCTENLGTGGGPKT